MSVEAVADEMWSRCLADGQAARRVASVDVEPVRDDDAATMRRKLSPPP